MFGSGFTNVPSLYLASDVASSPSAHGLVLHSLRSTLVGFEVHLFSLLGIQALTLYLVPPPHFLSHVDHPVMSTKLSPGLLKSTDSSGLSTVCK